MQTPTDFNFEDFQKEAIKQFHCGVILRQTFDR